MKRINGLYKQIYEMENLVLADQKASKGKADQIDEDWIKENLGIEDVYCGGASYLQIHWRPIGTAFQVEEYDGAESLRTMDDLCIVA